MWPFTKAKEKVVVKDTRDYYDYPRYRIKPENENLYFVESYFPYSGWRTCEEFRDNSVLGYNPYFVKFSTEKECEEWIKEKMDQAEKERIRKEKEKAFQEANPPREVPPYRYATKETTTST